MSTLNRLKKALGGSGKINESEFPKNIFLKDYLKPEIYGNASDHAKDAEKHKSDYIHKSENPKFGPNHEDTIKSKALWKWHTAQKHYHEGKPNSQSWYSSNMEDFEKLRRSHALLVNKKEKNIDETCWKDYTQVGMKMKNGKKVPNCVPAEGVPKQVKEDSIEEVLDTPEAKSSYIMKASDKNVKDAVSSAKDIFSSPEKFDKEQSKIKRRNKTVRKVLSKLNKEEVSESSDYFRRRQKEEDIISGKKPARKRIPKGNDYFQRRSKEEKNK